VCVCVCFRVCDPIITEKKSKNCALLGNYALSSGNLLPTFRDNLSVPLRRVQRRFRTIYQSHPQGGRMGPIGCSETSVRNYYCSLRNNPEEHSSHLLGGGSLRSRTEKNSIFFSLVKDSFSTRFRDLSCIA